MTNTQKQLLLAFLGFYDHRDDQGRLVIDGKWGAKSQEAADKLLEEFGVSSPKQEEKKDDLWDGIQYFTPRECKCKCGGKYCDGFPVQPDRMLLELADDVREHFGVAMIPTSVVRCEKHNAAVGGVSGSRHKLGKAMDFYIPGFTAAQILGYVNDHPAVRYAYAIDDSCVHMDVE